MSNARPRIILVGAGGYGRLYVEALTEQNMGADLTAICDVDPHIAERIPQIAQFNIPVYTNLDTLLADTSADLAILVSPVHFHTEMVLACLSHGLNVLCEKPLCLTTEEAETMQAAVKKSGKFLCIGYQLDYRRDVQRLKRDILSGRFGKAKRIAVYHGFRRGASYYARNNWAGHISCNGREVFDSPFTNACAHHFQMLTFLLGDEMHTSCGIESAEAELYRANPTIENYDIAALRFKTTQDVPILYYTAHPIRTQYWGPVGVLEFENATLTYTQERPVFRGVMKDGRPFDYSDATPCEDMQKLRDAIDAVRGGQPPLCGIEADLSHIRAVRLVQQYPITPVRPALIETEHTDSGDFYYVRNLEETLERCAKEWALPSELGISLR